MIAQQRRRLEKLERFLEEARSLVREILDAEPTEPAPKDGRASFEAEQLLETIKKCDRAEAERILNERNYRELGAIFIAAGGAVADSKKPKGWLINQILWRLFDFQRGHEAIRTSGSGAG